MHGHLDVKLPVLFSLQWKTRIRSDAMNWISGFLGSAVWNSLMSLFWCQGFEGGRLHFNCDGTRWRTWCGIEGENWRMEWLASTLHTTSEHGLSSITTSAAHTSAASSRQNWRPLPIYMDSSVSPKDEIWFLRVCHHIWNAYICGRFLERGVVFGTADKGPEQLVFEGRYGRYSTCWYQRSRSDWKWQAMFGVIAGLLLHKMR